MDDSSNAQFSDWASEPSARASTSRSPRGDQSPGPYYLPTYRSPNRSTRIEVHHYHHYHCPSASCDHTPGDRTAPHRRSRREHSWDELQARVERLVEAQSHAYADLRHFERRFEDLVDAREHRLLRRIIRSESHIEDLRDRTPSPPPLSSPFRRGYNATRRTRPRSSRPRRTPTARRTPPRRTRRGRWSNWEPIDVLSPVRQTRNPSPARSARDISPICAPQDSADEIPTRDVCRHHADSAQPTETPTEEPDSADELGAAAPRSAAEAQEDVTPDQPIVQAQSPPPAPRRLTSVVQARSPGGTVTPRIRQLTLTSEEEATEQRKKNTANYFLIIIARLLELIGNYTADEGWKRFVARVLHLGVYETEAQINRTWRIVFGEPPRQYFNALWAGSVALVREAIRKACGGLTEGPFTAEDLYVPFNLRVRSVVRTTPDGRVIRQDQPYAEPAGRSPILND